MYLSYVASQDYTQCTESNVAPDLCRSGTYDHARQLASEPPFKSFPSTAGESRFLFFFFFFLSK